LAEFDTKLTKISITDIPSKKMPPKRVSYDLTCKISYKYGMNSTNKPYARKRPDCQSVTNACCERFALSRFKNSWDNPADGYKHKISQCEESKLYVTQYMVKNLFRYSLAQEASVKLAPYCNYNPVHHVECEVLHSYIEQENKKIEKGLPKYTEDYKKCWNYINKLKTAAACMSCDADNQNYIDVDTKSVHVQKKDLEEMVEKCYDMAKFQQEKLVPIYPYYLQYADTVHLTIEGLEQDKKGTDNSDYSPAKNKPIRILQAVEPTKKDDKKPAAPAKKDDKKPVEPAKKDDKKPAEPAKKDDKKPTIHIHGK